MAISSGFSFLPGGFPAAESGRARSITVDQSGNLAIAAMTWASNGNNYSVLSFNPATSGWSSEANNTFPYQFPMSVLVTGGVGYTLDGASGLWQWGSGILSSGKAPYTSLFAGTSGIYTTNTTSVFTSGGSLVASGLVGVFAAVGSGSSAWLLGQNSAYYLNLSNGAVQNTSIPFSPLAIAASGAGVVVAGAENYTLGSGVYYSLAIGVSGSTLVAFPGSGTAQSWVLSGSPAVWNALATSTGLPSYTSGISTSFTKAGNTILMSDYVSGKWYAFSYAGGTLALLSQGSVTGIGSGIAITPDSLYAGMPSITGSGVYVLQASGASWAASGLVGAGWFPGADSILATGSDVFSVTYMNVLTAQINAAQLSLSNGTWSSGNPISLALYTAPAAYYDSTLQACYYVVNTGQVVSVQWTLFGVKLLQSGNFGYTSSTPPVGIISVGNQPIAITSGALWTAKNSPPSGWVNSQSFPQRLYAITSPAADYSIPVATASGISFYNFNANYSVAASQQGVFGYIASGGASLTSLTLLGYGATPSALGNPLSHGLVLATEQGGIGFLASGASGLTYCLASGGFSSMVGASGQIWLTTTVGGQLVAVSGL